MKAKDVMIRDVVTVGSDTTVDKVAALMCEHRISAVPVVDNDALVGIVSEGDLVRRQEIGSETPRQSWWLRLFGEGGSAGDYIRSRAKRVADVMIRTPITVEEDTPLHEIAHIFESRHIKRVPVLRDGKVVGLVSRANLIQALASTGAAEAPASVGDGTIREKLSEDLAKQSWWSGSTGNFVVRDGVVQFWGFYRTQAEKDAARVAAENVPGVKGVEDNRVPYNVAVSA